MKKVWVLTLFPEYFRPICEMGVASNLLSASYDKWPTLKKEFLHQDFFELIPIDLRQYVPGSYKAVDDTPYGGGPGMVMRADILKNALEQGIYQHYSETEPRKKLHIVFPSPRGAVWTHNKAKQFASDYLSFEKEKDIIFICGRYEGIDERFLQKYVDQHISLGDFILTGGELAVLCILDSALRFVPGVLGNKMSAVTESFSDGLLEGPQYTRPSEFEGESVPRELLSGHHKKVAEFRLNESLRLTKECRPDLWHEWQNNKGKKS